MNFFKRSLGQNFLIDKNIIYKIINLINIKNKDILEIGPGTGALTDQIINQNPKSLIAVEKDTKLFNKLKKKYKDKKNILILNYDILKIDIEKIIKEETIVFGNLPYNISSQILVKFLKFKNWPPKFSNLIFMFQRELGNKVIGKYLSADYGRLSILSNLRLSLKNKFLVSPNCFFPKPKVTSMVLHLLPKKEKYIIKNINNLEKVTNILFSNKRKMINKNIGKVLKDSHLKKIHGLKTNLRPEKIKPDFYYKITEFYEKG